MGACTGVTDGGLERFAAARQALQGHSPVAGRGLRKLSVMNCPRLTNKTLQARPPCPVRISSRPPTCPRPHTATLQARLRRLS